MPSRSGDDMADIIKERHYDDWKPLNPLTESRLKPLGHQSAYHSPESVISQSKRKSRICHYKSMT